MKNILLILLAAAFTACTGKTVKNDDPFKTAGAYNLKVIIYNSDITNPDEDDRCYYRIYVNKIERGRTSTGLESQEKTFEGKVSGKRNLISIEKWILDKKRGRYRKVNNVRQPRPSFYYFSIPEKRVLRITVKNKNSGRAEYSEVLEKK